MSDMTNEQMRALISDLVDPDPCHHDHHGYCQTHLWFEDEVCPHWRAQKLLEEAPQAAGHTEGNPR